VPSLRDCQLSYSWWGAWFGEARGGQIICPKEWVTIDDTLSPCPARWLQMENAVRPFQLDEADIECFATRLQRQRFDAAIRCWFELRGDQTLRLEFAELGPDSVVLDLGGYKGDWTAEITARYDATVHVFEPIACFHDNITKRFAANPKVHAHRFGLAGADQTHELHHSAMVRARLSAAGRPSRLVCCRRPPSCTTAASLESI
jgi:hypothetical protein